MDGANDDIQPISRDPLRFDLLQLFAAHIADQGGMLQDVSTPGEFFASLGQCSEPEGACSGWRAWAALVGRAG